MPAHFDRNRSLETTTNVASPVRRKLLKSLALGSISLLGMHMLRIPAALAQAVAKFQKSDAEWKERLTSEQYGVLRKEDTERPFTSPLNHETRAGMFSCVACDLPLFPSRFKFDSGTGWPSFFDALPGHVEKKQDFALLYPRTEYHCARCGGHHGHVFEDGPKPTGLRYCNNGVALKFIAEKTS